MAVSTIREVLLDARARHYAVGSINAWDIHSAKTLIETAERLRAPIIVSLWKPELELAGEKELYDACLSFASRVATPVVVFNDHAKTIAEVQTALALGASSVMLDGSSLPLDENIAFTARAARLANDAGVPIEGEIGVLGEEEGSEPDASLYTDPDEAARFAAESGVDALAVAIGNAHGYYQKEPKLDFTRLEKIAGRVGVPLVLHGGSDIPDADIRRAIEIGIAKINIGAEARQAFYDGLRASFARLPDERFPNRLMPPALDAYARLIEKKCSLFKSEGKAGTV